MAIFNEARELDYQRQSILQGTRRPKKGFLAKAGLAMIGLNEDMTTNAWGKINPFLSPVQATLGEAIDSEYNPASERWAQTMTAGKLAMNFVPGGLLAKIGAGMALDQAQNIAASQGTMAESGGASSGSSGIGTADAMALGGAALQNLPDGSTKASKLVNPMTGEAWTGSAKEHRTAMKDAKWMKEQGLLNAEETKSLDDVLAGRTINDDLDDVMKASESVDTDEILKTSDGLLDESTYTVGDTSDITSSTNNITSGVGKNKQFLKNFGKGLGAAATVMNVASDVMAFNKARQTADDAVKKKEMEVRRKKSGTIEPFSYT